VAVFILFALVDLVVLLVCNELANVCAARSLVKNLKVFLLQRTPMSCK
jgi:hypothetical protein